MRGLRSIRAFWVAPLVGLALLALGATNTHAEDVWALTTTNVLVRFDSATPGTILSTVPVAGLQSGENLLGIDFRPATGQLYGLGSTSRLYAINPTTGVANALASPFSPLLSGTDFGFDFNPTVDRIRVVSDADQNLRLNPDTGTMTVTDTPLAYTPGDDNAGANPNVVGAAYTNNVAGGSTTTLYGIDSSLDVLVTHTNPNAGILATVGPLGIDTSSLSGFDISATTGVAYAALTVGGTSRLYTINLATGAATLVGTIGGGAQIRGLALPVTPAPMIYAVTVTNNLVRFNSTQPGAVTAIGPITGLQAGENVLGIDFRPATGQLYALGSTSRLYTINTSTAVATQVGSPGSFTLSGNSFGFDFNPAIDRIRVVSDTDQNLRLNPGTGTITATDTPLAYVAGDDNAGANPNVVGAAYTNNFDGAASTTLYGIDFALDILVTYTNPNGGLLSTVGPLGVNASGSVGLDVSASNGLAYASLIVGGVSRLYTINLSTGAATLVGTIGGGVNIAGIAVAPLGRPAFSSSVYSVGESGPVAIITVNRLGGSEGPIAVDYAATTGSATAGSDFGAVSGTLTFASGQTSRTFTIPITDDPTFEGDETVNLTLSNPTAGVVLGAPSTAVLTIMDNDPAPPTPTPTRTPTPTPTRTPTITPTSTITPTPFPQPNVGVTVTPSAGTLQTTITARDAGCAGGNNQLVSLQFTKLTNATASIASPATTVTTTPTTVNLPARPASIVLTVQRSTAGQAATVELTVTDGCGSWPTFVGGGPSAF
jgi:hypothetical protein